MSREHCQKLISLRRNHPAWLLLASTKAPLTASCLKTILNSKPIGVPWEEAVVMLADIFTEYAHDESYEITPDEDQMPAARKEMRRWLSLGLVVERENQLIATDALERALQFLDELEDRVMTSTASRLATVQREIENLEARLNSDQELRISSLKEKMTDLKNELARVEKGEFEVLTGAQAQEGIREIHQLALSLKADFRRVEDSYREADRKLRQRILSEGSHRGEIVDNLLDIHDALVQTAEGQVFENFHDQLVKPLELDRMKSQLKSILENEATQVSLTREQRNELGTLVSNLVGESRGVLDARSRSERDVRSFLKSGLVGEQVRVGSLLQEIQKIALDIDWTSQKIRRIPSPLSPVAIANSALKVIERLTFRDNLNDESITLDLSEQSSDPGELGEDFWQSFQTLDRVHLFENTLSVLKASDRPLTLAELVAAIPTEYDLETLSYWLGMAREAGVEMTTEVENIEIQDRDGDIYRFTVPSVNLSYEVSSQLNVERLG
ncbi:MAG: DUF3375 domain-containing protein [Verrucomicrobiota bacterium]